MYLNKTVSSLKFLSQLDKFMIAMKLYPPVINNFNCCPKRFVISYPQDFFSLVLKGFIRLVLKSASLKEAPPGAITSIPGYSRA